MTLTTLRLSLAGALCIAATGCTSFATVRSAVVASGPSVVAQGALASPPGDAAGWFWSADCAQNCSHRVPGGDAGVAYGHTGGRAPFTLGLGVNGVLPYLEGYVQLRHSDHLPAGVGARVGIPVGGWHQHQVYARVDVPVSRDVVLLWNPGVVYHTGASSNGENPGTFLGLVHAVGFQAGAGPIRLVPSVGVVWGRAERQSYGRTIGPETQVFGFGAVALQFARRR